MLFSKNMKRIKAQHFCLKVIILTYNRADALKTCLKSLDEADYDEDRVDVEVWIDRSKENVIDNKTYHVASDFRWRHGTFTVHAHAVHVGIFGQWLSTWYPSNRPGVEENVVYIEDDIVVSQAFYKWLKTMHSLYSSRDDVSGFALQGKIYVMSGSKAQTPLSVPKAHPVFMYRVFGRWGFSPTRRVWKDFLDWYDHAKKNNTFQPYVPNIRPTSWFQNLQRQGRGDSMWSIWFLYYTYIKQMYCIFPNIKDGVLVVNKELPGLHYSANVKIPTYGLLRTSQLNRSYTYPDEPIKIHYDGSVVNK